MLLSCMLPAAAPFGELVEQARLADGLGYDMIACNHIAARDSFGVLAALAMVTERVHLATAVAPIYHRSPASTAQTAATVDDASGGRFRLGLGVGHRSTMAGWHGQEIGKPAEELREYVALVRALLTDAQPPAGKRWNSTFRFTGFTPRPDIPILLAALSPAMLRLAGEIADGVVLWACPAGYVRDVVVPEVAKGRAAVGKSMDGFAVMPAVPAAVDTDPAVVHDGLRTELHRYFGLPFYRAMFEAAGFGSDLTAFDNAPDFDAQKQAISERFLSSLAAFGDAEAVRAGIVRHRAAGATNPIIAPVRGSDFLATLHAASGGSQEIQR
jgi:alkanesulfonate monooxygenase SsuD/methylene tetrahydromethanopterin reductase-like flavin-dependent oxidoreductase (luciferase family)